MNTILLGGVFILGVAALAWTHRRRASHRIEASLVASELLPEIRTILDFLGSNGDVASATRFDLVRQKLPGLFRKETLFAVETFYQSVEAYRSASGAMEDAFAAASEASLGDRIRAKDRRDRCLKDVFYTGEAAIERLSRLS